MSIDGATVSLLAKACSKFARSPGTSSTSSTRPVIATARARPHPSLPTQQAVTVLVFDA